MAAAARSRFWMKILASALGKTVVLQDGSEAGPAFGAARLARLAATGEDPAEVCAKPAHRRGDRARPGTGRGLCRTAHAFPGSLPAVAPLY